MIHLDTIHLCDVQLLYMIQCDAAQVFVIHCARQLIFIWQICKIHITIVKYER